MIKHVKLLCPPLSIHNQDTTPVGFAVKRLTTKPIQNKYQNNNLLEQSYDTSACLCLAYLTYKSNWFECEEALCITNIKLYQIIIKNQ